MVILQFVVPWPKEHRAGQECGENMWKRRKDGEEMTYTHFIDMYKFVDISSRCQISDVSEIPWQPPDIYETRRFF